MGLARLFGSETMRSVFLTEVYSISRKFSGYSTAKFPAKQICHFKEHCQALYAAIGKQ